MKEGPDIALLGALIGDPARANMLLALLSGKALTAKELAVEANITPQTASSHLKKLETGGLIIQRKQGRHRYFALADEDVANVLETMIGLAAQKGHMRTRTGPKDPALRKARICYNHLAGDLGVRLYNTLSAEAHFTVESERIELTESGILLFRAFGIQLDKLRNSRRIFCKPCLDWSERQSHLAGALGEAILNRMIELKWCQLEKDSRIISFNKAGEQAFSETFF